MQIRIKLFHFKQNVVIYHEEKVLCKTVHLMYPAVTLMTFVYNKRCNLCILLHISADFPITIGVTVWCNKSLDIMCVCLYLVSVNP